MRPLNLSRRRRILTGFLMWLRQPNRVSCKLLITTLLGDSCPQSGPLTASMVATSPTRNWSTTTRSQRRMICENVFSWLKKWWGVSSTGISNLKIWLVRRRLRKIWRYTRRTSVANAPPYSKESPSWRSRFLLGGVSRFRVITENWCSKRYHQRRRKLSCTWSST